EEVSGREIGGVDGTAGIDDEGNAAKYEFKAHQVVVAVAPASSQPDLANVQPQVAIAAPHDDDAAGGKVRKLWWRDRGKLFPVLQDCGSKEPGGCGRHA